METHKKIGFVRKERAGELQIALQNDLFDTFEPECLFIEADGIPVPCFLKTRRDKGEDICCTFYDIPSERALQAFVGGQVYIELTEKQAKEYQQDSNDISGFTVKDTKGKVVGTITDIDTTTSNTLLLLDNGMLLPFHEDLLVSIDTNAQVLTMQIPEGL